MKSWSLPNPFRTKRRLVDQQGSSSSAVLLYAAESSPSTLRTFLCSNFRSFEIKTLVKWKISKLKF